MAVIVNQGSPVIYENTETEVFAISADKIENKLYKLLPRVDHTSNWISLIGVGVSILFGVLAYFTTDISHRPAIWAALLASIGSLAACVCGVILLIKGYNSLTPEQIIEEFKDGCSVIMKDGTKKTYHKRKPRVNKKK